MSTDLPTGPYAVVNIHKPCSHVVPAGTVHCIQTVPTTGFPLILCEIPAVNERAKEVANLFAAAPDLLEALRWAESYLFQEDMSHNYPLLVSVRAAIAKATKSDETEDSDGKGGVQ